MPQQINLYRVEFRAATTTFATEHMVKLGAVILIAVGLVWGGIVYRSATLRSQLSYYDQEQGALQQSLTDLSQRFAARDVDPTMMSELAKLEALVSAPESVRVMLTRDAFGVTDGYSDYFVSFARHAVSGMWLTGVEILGAGSQVTLRGRAVVPERVPQYLQRLSAEKELAGKEFELFSMERPNLEQASAEDGSTQVVPASYIEFVIKTKNEVPVENPS